MDRIVLRVGAIGIAAITAGAFAQPRADREGIERWIGERIAEASGPLPKHVGRYDFLETVYPSLSIEELNAAAERIRRYPDHPDWASLVAEHRRLTAGSEAILVSIWRPEPDVFRYSTTTLSGRAGADALLLDVAMDFERKGWSLSGGQLALLDGARPLPQRNLNAFLPMIQQRVARLFHGPFASLVDRGATVASVELDARSDSDYVARVEAERGPAVLIGLRAGDNGVVYRVVHWRVEAGGATTVPPGAPQPPVAFEVVDEGVEASLDHRVFRSIEGYGPGGELVRREDFVRFVPMGDAELRVVLKPPTRDGEDAYRGAVRVETVDNFRDGTRGEAGPIELSTEGAVVDLPERAPPSAWRWVAITTAVGGIAVLIWWRTHR